MSGKKWGKTEIDILIKNYDCISNIELYKLLPNRTEYSIYLKANRLGLKKAEEILIETHKKTSPKAELHHNWRGGTNRSKGYILKMCKDHPRATMYGYIPEHQLVIEKHIGRYLTSDEIVHHINEDRTDNRLENLILMKRGEHTKLHHTGAKRSKETCKNISKAKILKNK